MKSLIAKLTKTNPKYAIKGYWAMEILTAVCIFTAGIAGAQDNIPFDERTYYLALTILSLMIFRLFDDMRLSMKKKMEEDKLNEMAEKALK